MRQHVHTQTRASTPRRGTDRVEQVGPPDELYDHPNSEFVMSFLGPVTTLDNHLVRPHDLEIETHPFEGAYPGRIERFNRRRALAAA